MVRQHNWQLFEAKKTAAILHSRQVDKHGKNYIGHPLRVANSVYERYGDVDMACAAALHDVLEDTWLSEQTLAMMFNQHVVHMVKALTRRHGETYGEFIERLCNDPDQRVLFIKKHDTLDNLSPEREFANPTEKDKQRKQRYLKAIETIDHHLQHTSTL